MELDRPIAPGGRSVLNVFFATDVHGSNLCWKKFIAAAKFYEAQVLILGGDMTGKAIVPVVKDARNRYRVELMEQVTELSSGQELLDMETTIANKGYYPVRLDTDEMRYYQANPDTIDELFNRCVLERVAQWMEYADGKLAGTGVKCYVCPGNDDIFEVDEAVRSASSVELAEGRVIALDDHLSMVSTGWSNRTPWNTHRELDESKLQDKLEAYLEPVQSMAQCIFNMHCPAYNCGLDEAPELDEKMRPKYAGHVLVPCGSRAVRALIEKYQPLLALFGHIHEGRGTSRLGSTLCINPGSSYEQGVLLGAMVKFEGSKMSDHTLTSG